MAESAKMTKLTKKHEVMIKRIVENRAKPKDLAKEFYLSLSRIYHIIEDPLFKAALDERRAAQLAIRQQGHQVRPTPSPEANPFAAVLHS